MKNTLTGELRSVGGSNNVSQESPMSVSTANALIEKSVRETQSTSSMVRFARSEKRQMRGKLQVLFGSECSKGERKAPRCVILVRESENVRDERHEPRCVLPLLLQRYSSVCVPRGTKLELGPNEVFELPAEIVPHSARTTGEKGKSSLYSSL